MEDQMTLPDPEVLKEALFTGKPEVSQKEKVKKETIKEVDLHIEALSDDYHSLDNEAILNIQLSEFNTCLENAVISGAEQITFIHGIGNGILRNKIHKILSQYPHIKYFEDARKEKFGYGATKVHLK
jgi:dsDNA-specific endonuclease/ATPase MutS2